MGVAVQLCTLPWLEFVPDDVAAAPAAVVARLSEKLGIPVGALRGYGAREQTRTGTCARSPAIWAGGRSTGRLLQRYSGPGCRQRCRF